MTRRNFTTTFMVVGAGLLLFGGVALARDAQTSDAFRPAVVATPTADDHGGNGADDSLSPTATPDDHGNGADDAVSPTATPTATSPTATPDDHGGNGADDSVSPTATATATATSPTATPDDHGGNGGHGSDD